ncbi:MAG: response regulator [Desulfobacter sp.]
MRLSTLRSGFWPGLPEKTEAAYRSGFLPVQARVVKGLGSLACLALILGQLLFPQWGWAWILPAGAALAWSFARPASTLPVAGCQYLMIITVSALAVFTLPPPAWTGGFVLVLTLFLTAGALAGFRISMLLAVTAGTGVAAVYLFMGGVLSLSSSLGLMADGVVLSAVLVLGTMAGCGMACHHRSRFAAAGELERLKQALNAHEETRHEELVRVNKSLALEIRAHTEAETRLRESEEKYKNLVDSLPQGIFIVQNNRIVFSNPGLERLTGIQPESMSGMTPDTLFKRSGGVDASASGNGFDYIQGPDRSKTFIEYQWVKIRFNAEPARLYTVSDITERVKAQQEKERLESELEKAKKMEALGLLAGGVAHDLNNVLSGIVSTPELLLMDLPEDSHLVESIETMKDSGKRAAVIVDELLTLGRKSDRVFESVSVNEVVEGYLASPEFKKSAGFHPGVGVRTDMASDLPLINASGIHLRKVVMNLVINALEAVDTEGDVALSTAFVTYADKTLKGYEKKLSGSFIRFRVADTGPGIPPQDLDRIFEPFYTKKIMGRSGTGLGLSIVWSVVHDHKGCIQVNSRETGTVFDLYFPVSATLQEEDKTDKIYTLSDYSGRGESILVIDDDATQQKITTNMLKRLGYKVKALGSGEAGIDFLKNSRVDLVVLDMIMAPGMNGFSTFRELKAIDPDVKVLLASGYSKTEDVVKAQVLGAGAFLKKPFSLQPLGLAVKEELEG